MDSKMNVSKYIEINEIGTSDSGKTKVWEVRNLFHGEDTPGIIRWHGGWRKYVYECEASFYDWNCLRMIADFIEEATKFQMKRKV